MRPTPTLLLAIFAMILLTSMVSAMPTPENTLSLTPSTSSPSIASVTPVDPNTAINTTAKLAPVVKLHLFTSASCKGIYRVLTMEPNTCYGLNGAQALRVVDFDAGLKYNALRITRGEKCDAGWELQPLEEACSDVGVYGSIKVLVNTEW
ncbi:hypothetical protein FB567DRAFT_581774 [Paraphoma chrysanthemicola]|uniref:Uncharacterized protein n=1 Tax=Paraphoma chrysanthemicola TaxID=798071 RepID=A0A8K0VRP0_9PLEO|nr:hypothetical protein FB567DRAFT_585623 [Paraphoma chrysanthemicola]KAH7082430.1 hypothetical protein FB567DRAFT_581774 [Paraphoma chrysanthemicola]